MDEIVIARPTTTAAIIATAVAVLLIVGPMTSGLGVPGAVVGLVIVVALIGRFRQMKVSVTREAVVVVNFLSASRRIPLDSIRLVDRKDRSPLLSDLGGPFDTTGRTLSLADTSGREVLVELAPVYGSRLDDIAGDLYRAIATMQRAA